MKKFYMGFHLIEMLAVLTMLGIFAMLCFPLYTQYFAQARRMQAAATLAKLALAMEKFYLEHYTYQHATLAHLHFSEKIAQNNYRLIIKKARDNHFLLAAKPLGNQVKNDKQCGTLLLDDNNKKSITGKGDINACW